MIDEHASSCVYEIGREDGFAIGRPLAKSVMALVGGFG